MPEIRDLGAGDVGSGVRLIPFPGDHPSGGTGSSSWRNWKGELPGILAWAVRGCRLWLEEGGMLHPPGDVVKATESYREEMDRLVPFLDDCCLLDPEQQVSSKDLSTLLTNAGARSRGKKPGAKFASPKRFRRESRTSR